MRDDKLRGYAHETLRTETRHLHDALDSRLVEMNLASRSGYVDYLLINSACIPIEHALERAGIRNVLPDWEQRKRESVLTADLAVLGVRPRSGGDLTIACDIGSLLGWSYVLEGSRLGALVILQIVMKNSDADVRAASAFLRHGAGLHLWDSFKVRLGVIDADPIAVAMACAGADAAFSWFAKL